MEENGLKKTSFNTEHEWKLAKKFNNENKTLEGKLKEFVNSEENVELKRKEFSEAVQNET